ncbi:MULTISPECIES: bacillithiol biosynthesis cysteine-adding enzyme BshC [Paenibacillus]|uniref:bacillithiol biosynthesis cysteine-adding enzyme BshC n=1 Tax=Paenibacillus TaxID=44249 RepID=UPI00203B519E|nr:bacillithiol biosynthesis cysteine-adding enzyme BshC [Paenibacillus camelliae]
MTDLQKYELPIAQQLTADYIDGKEEVVRSLYGYYSGNEEDWTLRSKRLDEHAEKRASSAELAAVLRSYMGNVEWTEQQQKNLLHIEQGAQVVIGGQQAGLWSGPLLVVHKAVSIILAAESASKQLKRPIVPVFWIAGEDHDWDEVNHTYIVGADQSLKKLILAKSDNSRTSVSRTEVSSEQWKEAIAELSEQLPGSEFKEGLVAQLMEIAENSKTLSQFFAAILQKLFASYGLLYIDSDYAELRALEKPMFRQLLQRNNELESAYMAAAEQVRQLSYTLQADVNAGSSNLFLFAEELGGDRTLLYKQGDKFQDRKGQVQWSYEQLLQLLEEHPASFSNNVLTRPLMQDYVFPVLATVLGPGEISYWALTGQAFKTLDMEMPIIVPRMSYTLVEGIIAKNMDKYDLSFRDVMEHFQERKKAWLQEQDELHIKDRFEGVKEQFVELYKPLIELAGSIQAGLTKLGETNMSKIVEQISFMESKTIDAQEKQFEAAIRQLDRVELALKPAGKPQERVLSMISYWNRYDAVWLEAIMNAPYSRTGGHEIVKL